ncbi:beta strand repeat-containing protein [Flavobacterium psychraquaticum]|uniref:beta strand repeat-containing protein n=1 Tax=Flavobacterium psychraquaticum TaxID=3103958 RepID=UPI002ACE670A|nr:GEVED domain-containing protein [Flavobacterium sp. LB-N7T]
MKQKYNLANGFERFRNIFKNVPVKILLIAVVLFFGVMDGYGQALLPVYNTDPTIPQAGWAYGVDIDAPTLNLDCTGTNAIRFNGTTNENVVVNYATAATNVSFNIQRNNNNNKELLVEQSVDGITYTTVATITNTQVAVDGTTYTLNYALNSTSRYVRFNMTVRVGGAYFLDAIAVYNTTAPLCGCTSVPTSNDGSGITSTTVGSATFSVADVTYYNYVGSVPNLTAGGSITSSITFATGFTYDSHIWIDFNDDGVFDNTTERVYSGASLAANPTTLNTTFPLPAGATPGQHKMRIGTADSGQATPNPCYSGTYGVTIELFVNIIVPTPPTITSFTPSNACASSSQTVVITGTNFTGATAVTIGGTAAVSYIVNSATQITATIGTGTTGVIRVTTAGGIATSAGNFTVNPLPAAIGGGAATVCTGATSPAFTNATVGGTWSITNGTGSATISAGGVVTAGTAGTVTVVYTLPTTCSITRALTVQQTPGAIAGGAATVCVGASTPAFTNPNGGGTWSVLAGSGTATISAGGVLTGTGAGTVTVRYTIGACTPATFGVTVNAVPVITTQPIVASICTTNSGTFSVVATGATTYQWRKDGVALTNVAPYSGVTSATLTITNPAVGAAGNFDVIVGNGTCSVTSALRALTVLTAPAAVATPTPANTVTGVCYAGGGAVTSISWGSAAGATSYDVYFGAGSLPGAVTANVATNSFTTGTLLANTTYYWRIVAKNGCGNAATSATFSFTTASGPC